MTALVKNDLNVNLIDINSYTPEQQEVITCSFPNALVVKAFAGTGKTSTLKGFCQSRPNSRILYLAYNKSIGNEVKAKFKELRNVDVFTTHGLAYKQYGARYKERFDKYGMNLSTLDYVEYCDDVDEENRYSYAYVISQLIKDFSYSAYTIDEYIQSLLEDKELFENKFGFKINYFLSKLEYVWDDILENDNMPFEHDFYLKLYQLENPYLEQYNYILLDEAQDANDCVIDIILQQSRSKKVFVGDDFQQIYAWRGATNALNKVGKMNGTVVKFLTKSFRCSQEIAEIADVYLQISGAEKTFIGNGNVIDDEADYKEFAIIARSNIQLFEYAAFQTGESKLYFVGGFNSYNFYDLVDLVKLRYKNENDDVEIYNPFFKNFNTFEELKDYAENANEIELLSKIKVSVSIPSISKELYALKQRVVNKPEDAEVILTTAHKSKGLEWDSIFLPKGYINLAEEEPTQEEINLLYVALTRAKKRIISDTIIVQNKKGIAKIKKEQKEIYIPIQDQFEDWQCKKGIKFIGFIS
jgi:superfamily I DNA/RNA helicase